MNEPTSMDDALRRLHTRLSDLHAGNEVDPRTDPAVAEAARIGLEQVYRLRWAALIPPRFQDADVNDFPPDVALDLAGWAETPHGRNLVILGPVGTGKSHAAVASVRPHHFHGLDVRFFPVVDLLDTIRRGYREDERRDVLGDLVDLDRLVVDDLGAERMNDWTAERVYTLVNRRWLDERPTVVTSNLEPEELEKAVGPRVFSRLVGNDAVVLRLTGPDRRRRRG